MRLAERARPRAQQAPSGPTRWIFTDISLALDTAAPEDGRAPLNRYGGEGKGEAEPISHLTDTANGPRLGEKNPRTPKRPDDFSSG